MSLNQGFIHVYTGNGKGKTTAAIGLSIRAVGAGLKVFFGQFLKTDSYSEHNILRNFKNITLKTFGRDCLIKGNPEKIDYELAKKGLKEVKNAIFSGEFDLIIMDEINVAVFYNLIDKNDVIEILKNKPENVEVVLTGRYADKDFIDIADLVTEFREIKHYYQKGVLAREGIEK